jgi:hypothetical protein
LKQKYNLASKNFLTFGLLFLMSFVLFPNYAKAATVDLSGWAWSELSPGSGTGLGWISFNSANVGSGGGDYKVVVNTTTGEMSGNAWTLHGYTLTFNSSELGGCPTAPDCSAKYNPVTHSLSGWAKFKYVGDGGGWDGWLSLSGSGYGVVGTESGGIVTFSGSAYGDDVVGWVSFDGVTTGPVTPDDFNYSLSNSRNVTITKAGSPVSGSTVITKTLLSTSTQAVDLSIVESLPSGISYTFSKQGYSPSSSSTLLFTVQPTAPSGTYPITVKGTPLDKTTTLTLTVKSSVGPVATCSASPFSSVKVGQPVTWTANVSGGTAPYTYVWSGSNIPTNPAPTTNPFSIIYTTVGLKTAQVVVTDSAGKTTSCSPAGSVYINFDPKFEEF